MNQLVKCALLLFLLPLTVLTAEGGSPESGHGGGEASKVPLPPPKPAGPENINTYLHIEVNNMTKAAPPRVWDHKLILSFDRDPSARYVAAAFAHEEFREKHLFFKNRNNVFFLVLDIPEDAPETLEYRLIVDGLWKSDPANSQKSINDQGILLSQVSLQTTDKPRMYSPIQHYGGTVEFRYKGKPGLQIAVVGNFNNWDPFVHFLEEDSSHPGEYTLQLTLPSGPVFYKYAIGTRTILDPLNPRTGSDSHGDVLSYFENKKQAKPTIMESRIAVLKQERIVDPMPSTETKKKEKEGGH